MAKFKCSLSSVGNPDYGQYKSTSPRQSIESDSIKDIISAAEKYRKDYYLGSGNWTSPWILFKGEKVLRISYNGSLWTPDGVYCTLERAVEVLER